MSRSSLVWLWYMAFLQARARPLNDPILDSYDYIVVGGGASGLTVANRLSEDPSVTVLVLEAGQADNYEQNILVPIFTGSELVSQYNWGINTVNQTYLDGASRWLPQGKALGGGTILNALLWNRGNAGDFDAWVDLGSPGWGWADLLPYFMKSETYTPVESQEIADTYGIINTPGIHGYSGPVSVTYQKYFYNVSIQWFDALASLGVPVVEPNDGVHAGAMFLPMDLNASNMTRADARRSYYDPVSSRSNFYVSTGQHVTKLIFDSTTCHGASYTGSTRRIAGVNYATANGKTVKSVYARREVILAAGSLHTPQLLELSGIGMKSVLDEFGIAQQIDLPGVGNNLQDHFQAGLWSYLYNSSFVYPTEFNNNATLMKMAGDQYYANRTGPWTAGPPDGVAFPSLSQISDKKDAIAASASAQSTGQYLGNDLDPTVVAGYEAMKPLLASALRDPKRSVIEILNNNAGGMSMSNMRPFCRGHSHIRSANPFDGPIVDPRWGSNPIDIDVLVEAVYFNRKVFATPFMEVFGAWQAGPSVAANESAIRTYLAGNGGTEFHPSGTCAMLPKSLGGVVSPDLLVYGTSNLRIVDASIHPVLPAAHLQAVVYGVAEKAADIIKRANTSATTVCSTFSSSTTAAHLSSSSPSMVGSSHYSGSSPTPVSSSSNTFKPSHPASVSGTPYSSEGGVVPSNTVPTNPPAAFSLPFGHLPPWMSGIYRHTQAPALNVTIAAPSAAGKSAPSVNTSVQRDYKASDPQTNAGYRASPPMHGRAILFPGSYPDTHPFDHPWEPEPVWNPKAIEQLIPVAAYGPAPSPGSGGFAAWPVYGRPLAEPLPGYAQNASVASAHQSGH